MSADESEPSMDEPEPADDWPDGPLTQADARDLLGDENVVAVWERPPDEETRESVLTDEDPEDAVVELVIETSTEYRMYSYAHHLDGTSWMDYGAERKGTEGAELMLDTLGNYRVLVGSSGAHAAESDADANAIDAAEAAASGESVDAEADDGSDPADGDPGSHPR